MVCSKLLAKLGKTDDSKQTLKIVGWMIDFAVAFAALFSLGTWLLVSIVFEHLSVKAMAISFAKFSISATLIITVISSVVASCYMTYLYFQNKEKFEAIVKAAKLDKLNQRLDRIYSKIGQQLKFRNREEKLMAKIDEEAAAAKTKTIDEKEKARQKLIGDCYDRTWKKIQEYLGSQLYGEFTNLVNNGSIERFFNDPKKDINHLLDEAESFKKRHIEASRRNESKAENNSACGSHEPEADSTYTPPKTTTPTIQETIKTVTTSRENIASEVAEITTEKSHDGESIPTDAPASEIETIDEVLNQVPAAQPAISREDVLSAQILEEMIIPEDVLDKAKGSFEKELELHPTIAKIIDGRRELAIQMMQSGISRRETFAELGRQPLPQIGHNAAKERHQIQIRQTNHQPVEAIVAQ